MTVTETHPFQAEVNEVLSIVVNSLYSHREVFLRELISNASDALDRRSFEALTRHELKPAEELSIDILPSKESGTLTIRDNGIGMTHDELRDQLGTIARSGSKALMQSLSGDRKKDLSLIGQFGVGFYSAFLVADRVTVVSKKAGSQEPAWEWESDAKGEFTLRPSEKEQPGTNVILHLKEDAREFLEEGAIRTLVRKYSDYVRYPIRLRITRTRKVEGEEGKTETVQEWEVINSASALWTRPRSEISREQYEEFYKHLSHDWEPPLAWTHFHVEGTQELTGLLFVPRRPPFDLFERRPHGLRLHVKRVFIMDDCEELLPQYLRFVRGVVDSEDLPLNVSREMLQEARATRAIARQVTNKTLSLLEELAAEGKTRQPGPDGKEEEVDRYEIFWRSFGRVLKEGVSTDFANRTRIAKLLRYESSEREGLVSLADYVARMRDDQPGIYYVTAPSVEAARHSPHLEALRAQGFEVLLMGDPIDEWVVEALGEFEGKKLIPAAKGALELPETEERKKEREAARERFAGLLEALRDRLQDEVAEVRLSNRLTESPACLVTSEHGLSPHVEMLLRANGQEVSPSRRILEINASHPLIERLRELVDEAGKSGELDEWARLLYDQALVAEGSLPSDPGRLARAINKLMQKAAAAP